MGLWQQTLTRWTMLRNVEQLKLKSLLLSPHRLTKGRSSWRHKSEKVRLKTNFWSKMTKRKTKKLKLMPIELSCNKLSLEKCQTSTSCRSFRKSLKRCSHSYICLQLNQSQLLTIPPRSKKHWQHLWIIYDSRNFWLKCVSWRNTRRLPTPLKTPLALKCGSWLPPKFSANLLI